MEEFYNSSKPMSLDHDKTARELLVCRNLMDRWAADDYVDQELEEVRNKFNYKRLYGTNAFKTSYSPLLKKELDRLYKKKNELRKYDLELFCSILKRKLVTWWD